jgi:zinc protease
MKSRPAAVLALFLALLGPAAASLAGEGIPSRPEQLRFDPLQVDPADPASLRHLLAGEIPVYVAEDRALPLVDVTVLLRAGAFLDPPGKDGLSNLTSALVRHGGTDGRRPEEVDEKAQSLAARIESSAGDVYVALSLNCLSSRLDEGLDLLFEMLVRPAFQAGALEVEKRDALAAMATRNDDANQILDREWVWLLYGRDHVVARHWTAAGISSISREDLVGFHSRFWTPANMIVSVSGDVDPADILKRLEARVGAWKRGQPAPWPPEPATHRPAAGLFYVDADFPQAQVTIGRLGLEWAGQWDAPDRYAAILANQVLGAGGFSSRLMRRLRTEEGLVYGVSSDFGVGPLWPEPFEIRFAADPAKVPQAIAITLAELRRLCDEKVSEGELDTAKSQLLAQLADSFGSPKTTAFTFALDEVLGRPQPFWLGYRARVLGVTAAEVRAAACQYLRPETMLVLVVGSWDKVTSTEAAKTFPSPAQRLPQRDPLTLAMP